VKNRNPPPDRLAPRVPPTVACRGRARARSSYRTHRRLGAASVPQEYGRRGEGFRSRRCSASRQARTRPIGLISTAAPAGTRQNSMASRSTAPARGSPGWHMIPVIRLGRRGALGVRHAKTPHDARRPAPPRHSHQASSSRTGPFCLSNPWSLVLVQFDSLLFFMFFMIFKSWAAEFEKRRPTPTLA
jgi:hypothetical protein